MMKLVSRVVLFCMLAQMWPAQLWAQQSSAQNGAAKVDTTQATPPPLDLFLWKELGESPLCTAEMLPSGYGKGDTSKDFDTIQRIVEGSPGFETCHKLFWGGVSMVFFRGGKVDPRFEEQLRANVRAGKMERQTFKKDFVFYPCGMAWGSRASDGSYRARFTGNPKVEFDEPLDVYMIDPIKMPSGPYYGWVLAPIIPVKCVNLTCMNAVETTAPYLDDAIPAPIMKSVKVKNEYRANNGKAVVPSREEAQARIVATPKEGGETVRAEMHDNKSVELKLEAGKTYVIREILESSRWRLSGNEEVTIKVGDKNKDVEFEKSEIPTEQRANVQLVGPPGPQGPLGPVGPRGPEGPKGDRGEDGDGKFPTWAKWAIPIIAGVAVGALFLPKGKDRVVVRDAGKGTSSPGPSPGMSIGFTVGIGGR